MLQLAISLRTLALALWFGGGLALLTGARAIFRVADSRKQGGLFSGAVLQSFFKLRLGGVGLALASFALGARGLPSWLALAACVFTLAALPLDRSLVKLRDELGGSTEGLPAGDPRRKRFGALHGVSVLLLLAQVLCAGAGLALL